MIELVLIANIVGLFIVALCVIGILFLYKNKKETPFHNAKVVINYKEIETDEEIILVQEDGTEFHYKKQK